MIVKVILKFLLRDCIIISLLDTFTSLLAGCVIFAVLGNMAYENGEDIKDVVTGGPGLAFIGKLFGIFQKGK